MEKRFHFKLSFNEKMQLKAHKMMCDACTRYEEQSEFLGKWIRLHHEKLQNDADMDQLKEQINLKLNGPRYLRIELRPGKS
jgi:hypothetical protein